MYKFNPAPRIWEFDVDGTLIERNLSEYPDSPRLQFKGPKGHNITVIPNQKNINLLTILSKTGWYIKVHSGTGAEWAKLIVDQLDLSSYVDEVSAKPLGRTDDQPFGDGYAYNPFRLPTDNLPGHRDESR